MTTEQRMYTVEENYIDGNWTEAIKQFKKLCVTQRKEYAVNALYATYNADFCKNQKYEYATSLIRNI